MGYLSSHDIRDGFSVPLSRSQLTPPSYYRVALLNDDYTPMDFVVRVLKIFLGMCEEQAIQVMLEVHTRGKSVCGIYTYDIAETKAYQINHFAREHGHPLLSHPEVV